MIAAGWAWGSGVLLATLALSAWAAEAENLVANPSFEEGRDIPGSWECASLPGCTLSRDAATAHSGAASARIDITPEGAPHYPAFKYALRPAWPGEVYQGSAWARTQAMTDLGGYLVIEFYQGDRRLSFAQGDFTYAGDHDWMELKVAGMVPEGSDSIKLGLVSHGIGTVWFDDVNLVRVTEAPPPFQGDRLRLRVRADRVLCEPFLGFGAHGDFFLTRSINTDRGVDRRDRERILRRVEAMRPHLVRTLFDYKWWEPEEGRRTPDSEAMRDYIGWVRFLQSIGASVLLTPWGDYFAYSEWMKPNGSKLPAPQQREAMLRSLVELVAYLRQDQGLDNLKYLCLMNEPDNDPTRPVPVEEFVRLNRRLDHLLRERGLRDEIFLLSVDDSSGGPLEASAWYRQVVAQGVEYCDGISVHTYKHEQVPSLLPWIRLRRGLLPLGKPLLITEFGYGGETFKNWENHKYEYGLFLADFAIAALQEGASAALMWCLMDTYYTPELKQEYGLWRHRDEGWEPRPGFYAWSLLTRYTRPGSQVVAVETEPPAAQVRAVALISSAGEFTMLVVNRLPRPLQVTLETDLQREAVLRLYRYTRDNVPTPDGSMIGASDTLRARPNLPLELELPAESLTVLTQVE